MQYRRLVLPQWDRDSLASPLAWKLYYIEVKQRILPPLVKYQATLSFVHGFRSLLTNMVSKQSMLRMNQHPPRRAVAIAERESDRLQVGMEIFVASIWANVIFFAANYTVDQIGVCYEYYCKQVRTRSRQMPYHDKEDVTVLMNKSWSLLMVNARRLFYSAIGAGLGSILMPGWGTLLGIGIGDEWAGKQTDSELPKQVSTVIQRVGSDMIGLLRQIQFPSWFSQRQTGNDGATRDVDEPMHDDLICGCCQTTVFSSNPNCRDAAPISSRTCSHTICKSCVQKCHLAYMERTSTFEEWVRCPLCNATKAFSSHDHLVNRSFCAAIAAIEKSQSRALEKAIV